VRPVDVGPDAPAAQPRDDGGPVKDAPKVMALR